MSNIKTQHLNNEKEKKIQLFICGTMANWVTSFHGVPYLYRFI